MLEDALWTTLYSNDQIRLIEEHEQQDEEVLNLLYKIIGLVDEEVQ